MARALARELSENGVQIISGMARGIDTYSQIGALEGGTPTFAVLEVVWMFAIQQKT